MVKLKCPVIAEPTLFTFKGTLPVDVLLADFLFARRLAFGVALDTEMSIVLDTFNCIS